MTASATPARKPRVLLTNDDGPPSAKESPNIYSFARKLESELGWDVKVSSPVLPSLEPLFRSAQGAYFSPIRLLQVVVPASQKSWIGKAYQIKGERALDCRRHLQSGSCRFAPKLT
jgi:tubulin--tyrosine ligase